MIDRNKLTCDLYATTIGRKDLEKVALEVEHAINNIQLKDVAIRVHVKAIDPIETIHRMEQ